jgi:TRAP-type mannitol/chloroaromatic compound transport system substrate-binding protein
MKRRRFVEKSLGVAAGAAASTVLLSCKGQAGPAPTAKEGGWGKKVRWRLASSFPHSLDTIFGAAEVFAARVAALSEGNFTIKVHAAGELVPGLQVLDAVQQGSAEMGHTASYYYIGKNPALAFDTCVPFGLNSRQHSAWLLEGGGMELLRKVFSDFNIVNLPGGNTGAQMGGWFKREIPDLEALKGLKMRIPGLGGKVMTALGVNAQVLPGGEIFPALERGAIDAAEWVGPYDDEKLGLHKAAPFYYYPGWWEPGPALSFYVHKAAWEKLPKSYQAMLEVAAQEATAVMQGAYDSRNPAALERLLAQKVELRAFSEGILVAARKISEELLQEEAKKSQEYRTILEHWSKARAQMTRWFSTAELSYEAFVAKSPG